MRKLIAGILALTFSVCYIPNIGQVFGMTIVDDAETAVAKNKALFLKAWDSADIDSSFTYEQLEDMIFEACEYSSDKYVGAGFVIENFRVSSKSVTADIIIYQDDAEEGFNVTKTFASSGNDSSDDDSSATTDDNKNQDSELDASAAKKELESASHAISAAIWDFEVSNDTTRNDILNMAKSALPAGSHVSVSIDSVDFTLTKATTRVTGSLSATVTLTCAGQEKRCPVGKTIELLVTENSKKIDEDAHEVSVAVDALAFNNKLTQEKVLASAKNAIKNGSSVICESFAMKKATYFESGQVTFYLKLTLQEETKSIRFDEKLSKLVRKIPSEQISINADEWEILRGTNVERAKLNLYLLSACDLLQQVCDLRETELYTSYSHTRPNDTICFTAIPTSFSKRRKLGENIAKSDISGPVGSDLVSWWVDSPGHYANMVTPEFALMGSGYSDTRSGGVRGVQMFSSYSSAIVSVTTSANTFNFEDEDAMQKEYLICTHSDGLVSYLPIDVESMKKSGNTYTPDIPSAEEVVLTVGDASQSSGNNSSVGSNTSSSAKDETETAFADVKADAYYADAVAWAVKNNITSGTSATTFSPDDTCTRAQILSFLWRAAGSPKPTIQNPFTDVNPGDYYYDAAVWASEKSMVTGSTFAPNTPCTRSSTVMYMWKNAGSPEYAPTDAFSDVQEDGEYAEAVSWALDSGVTSGTSDTTFSPDDICNRAQIVSFLRRAFK